MSMSHFDYWKFYCELGTLYSGCIDFAVITLYIFKKIKYSLILFCLENKLGSWKKIYEEQCKDVTNLKESA